MTVRELIQGLLDHDLDAQVYVQSTKEGGPAQDFELVWYGTALMLNRTRDAVAPVPVSEFKAAMAELDRLQKQVKGSECTCPDWYCGHSRGCPRYNL